MTVKQQTNYGIIQKLCHLHNGIFHHIHLGHSLLILPSPVLFIKNNKTMD